MVVRFSQDTIARIRVINARFEVGLDLMRNWGYTCVVLESGSVLSVKRYCSLRIAARSYTGQIRVKSEDVGTVVCASPRFTPNRQWFLKLN